MKHSGIYRILNRINDLGYVGSSKSIEERFWGHRTSLRRNEHHSPHLQNAWNKYGEEVFKFEIIEIIENPTKELLEFKEQYWIDYYKSADKKYGYNICKKAYSCFGIERLEKETTKHNKQYILEFCIINGYRPSRKSKDFIERHLGSLLDSYVKEIHASYDPEFRKIILFYPSSRTYRAQEIKTNILEFIGIYKHLPSDCSKNKIEAKLGQTLQYIRDIKSELYDPIFSNKILGVPTKRYYFTTCHKKQLRDFIINNGFIPSSKSKNGEEKTLGRYWLEYSWKKGTSYDKELAEFLRKFPTFGEYKKGVKNAKH